MLSLDRYSKIDPPQQWQHIRIVLQATEDIETEAKKNGNIPATNFRIEDALADFFDDLERRGAVFPLDPIVTENN